MTAGSSSDVKFDIGHVLLIDIVGYSRLLINEQRERLETLNEIVRNTAQFRESVASGMLVRLPTGDGMALIFRDTLEAPVRCALEIGKALKNYSAITLRMGIHSGPVSEVRDVNERANIAGAGINTAQRVMDCGGAGHILLSKRVAEDLGQYRHWQPYLHELGECEVKHGDILSVVNFYTDEIGNPEAPEKFKRRERRGVKGVVTSGARRAVRPIWLAVGVAAPFVLIAAFWFLSHRGQVRSVNPPAQPMAARPGSDKSIAVLPFENLSGDPNNAYFTEGVQEEILTRLARIADLKVISRTSTQHFKSSPDNLPQIAKELGVANILEGSVQRAANQVRVNVQLINAANDAHLWAESFDRKLTDIFAVETDIAKAIAETLRVRLTGTERQQLAKRPTENLRALEYYMQGRSYIQRRTREDLLNAIHYNEKALEEDPNYALAYAGLSDAYANLGLRGYIEPLEGRRKTEEYARKALELDENLAEAHVAIGQAYIQFTPYNLSLGDRELRRAIELSPSLAMAHEYLGFSLLRQGRLDEGLAESLKAREFDPLSSIIAREVSFCYHLKRSYGRALELLRRANELGPALSTQWEIGMYIQNGSYNEALAELEKAKRERKDDSLLIYDAGMIYAAQGKRTEALQTIKELEAMSGRNLDQAHWIAKIYAALNEKELALTWLERGLPAGAIGGFYKDEPVWDPIRSEPRFADLVRRMGIP